MGAWFAQQTGTGKDMSAAFRAVVEQAGWEHGHGGYSGSMAEKRSYVQVVLPKGLTAGRLVELALQAMDLPSVEYARESVHYARSAAEKKRAQRELTRTEKQVERFWAKMKYEVATVVRQAAQAADDKWGPAVGVEVSYGESKRYKAAHGLAGTRTKVFLFFGYCSS